MFGFLQRIQNKTGDFIHTNKTLKTQTQIHTLLTIRARNINNDDDDCLIVMVDAKKK